MTAGAGFDPAFTAAVVSAAGIVIGIVVIAAQLLTSTRAASTHLAKGNALSSGVDSAHVVTDAGRADEAASRRRFSAQLNEYYAANISQGNAIFWASLLSMSIGFAIIFVGVITAGKNSANAIVAGIAGVLSQFVGATFLVALRSTQAQSTAYAQTLVELQLHDARSAAEARSLAVGLALVNDIAAGGATELANQTRATIATALITKDGASVAAPQGVVPIPVAAADVIPITSTAPRARVESVKLDETAGPGPRDMSQP